MNKIFYDQDIHTIALVGPIAAGKGTAAEVLMQLGYVVFNYGDIIYEERTARGLKEERKNSNAVGAALRSEFGHDIIAKRLAAVIEKYLAKSPHDKILIDGLRHPAEVKWVKENLNARVLGITASADVRYKRSLARNRIVDPKSPEDFTEADQQDRGVHAQDHENQTDNCLLVAEVVIENNNGTMTEYKVKIFDGLRKIGVKNVPKNAPL